MTYSTIELIYEAALATITLNRPEKRNAISFELISDLMRALDEVAQSPARVLIITGAGKAFCSGMDLKNLKALIGRSPEQSLEDSRTMVRLFRTIYEFPKVTVAAVNGAPSREALDLRCCPISRWQFQKPSSATPRLESDSCPRSCPPSYYGKSEKNTRAICC